ncbi:hypothetical protein [Mycobacterium sp. MAA66]|uniref:hypothetical protein n=1 Tax=Mycobacterium sp. MAA66 TaxID=3156297 RepID=UPI0035169BE2
MTAANTAFVTVRPAATAAHLWEAATAAIVARVHRALRTHEHEADRFRYLEQSAMEREMWRL